ncbi:GFA family protein [Aurantivibrio infirmus]
MITGGCRCGQVSFKCEAEPSYVGNCHCMDCQKFNAAPFVTWATFKLEQVALEEGRIKEISCTPGVTRGFCGECGTQIFWRSEESSAWLDITVLSLDNPVPYWPKGEAFVSRKLPWVTLNEDIPHYQRGPFDEGKQE